MFGFVSIYVQGNSLRRQLALDFDWLIVIIGLYYWLIVMLLLIGSNYKFILYFARSCKTKDKWKWRWFIKEGFILGSWYMGCYRDRIWRELFYHKWRWCENG